MLNYTVQSYSYQPNFPSFQPQKSVNVQHYQKITTTAGQRPQNYATHVGASSTNTQSFSSGPYHYPNPSQFNTQTTNFQTAASNTAQRNALPSNIVNNFQQNNGNAVDSFQGDYVSQSEASQLDQYPYPYKQQVPGDNRQFKRIVTTCYPGGRCENSNLEAGAVDENNKNILNHYRAIIQRVDKNAANGNTAAASSNIQVGTAYNQAAATLQPTFNDRGYLPPVGNSLQQSHVPAASFVSFATAIQPQVISGPFTDSSPAFAARPEERRLYPYNEFTFGSIYN